MLPPLRTYLRLLLAAAAVVGVDQVTKQLALDNLSGGETIAVIDGILTFRLAFNSGGAFGVLQGLPGLFLVATFLVVIVILLSVRRLEDPRWVIPLGMILGGGLGNLYDRLFRDFDGRVVDFINLQVWPIFNVADSAIVTGALLILLLGVRSKDGEEPEVEQPAAERDAAAAPAERA